MQSQRQESCQILSSRKNAHIVLVCVITEFFVTLSSTQASFPKQDHAVQCVLVVFSDGAECGSG